MATDRERITRIVESALNAHSRAIFKQSMFYKSDINRWLHENIDTPEYEALPRGLRIMIQEALLAMPDPTPEELNWDGC